MADSVVLIVDDNEDNRFTLSMRLQACGYENIVTAENGREALEKMRQGPVDLVLLDIMMPELDGYGVLEELRTDTALRDVPVVMISALEDINSVVRCIELGATDYLTKPFNPVLLKARVDNCVEKARYKAQEAAHLARIESEKARGDGCCPRCCRAVNRYCRDRQVRMTHRWREPDSNHRSRLRKALLGVANRRRRHERRSHLQVQVRNGNACLEWLPIAFPFAEGREFESVFLQRRVSGELRSEL